MSKPLVKEIFNDYFKTNECDERFISDFIPLFETVGVKLSADATKDIFFE